MLRLEQLYSESFLRLSEEEPSENMAAAHVFSSAAAHCQLWHRVGLRRWGDFSNSTWGHFYWRNSFGKCGEKKVLVTFSLTRLFCIELPSRTSWSLHKQRGIHKTNLNKRQAQQQHSKPASDHKSSLTSPATKRQAWHLSCSIASKKSDIDSCLVSCSDTLACFFLLLAERFGCWYVTWGHQVFQ